MAGEPVTCSGCSTEMGVFWNEAGVIRPVDPTSTAYDEYTDYGWWLHKCEKCGYEEHEVATEEQ